MTVVDDHVSLCYSASKSSISQTLSWFGSINTNNRFLATAIEVIVTTDIKYEYTEIKPKWQESLLREVPTQGIGEEEG